MATEVLYFDECLDLRTEAAKRLIEQLRDKHKRSDGFYPICERCWRDFGFEHSSVQMPLNLWTT